MVEIVIVGIILSNIGRRIMSDIKYSEVLEFWFSGAQLGKEQMDRWWKKNREVDEIILNRYSRLVVDVASGLHKDWAQTPKGRLAAILCMDQFPRNMYRDSGDAFQYDSLARDLVLKGLETGQDLSLGTLEKSFFIMPLMHDENLENQKKCVDYFSMLVSESSGAIKTYMANSHQFAIRHERIIRKFGRFPHRNNLLSRDSTESERLFLLEPGSSF